MRFIRSFAAFAVILSSVGCREVVVSDYPFQRVVINDFSQPIRSLAPARETAPDKLTLRVNGFNSQPVELVVEHTNTANVRSIIRRDTLAAGTHTNRVFSNDFYGLGTKELIVNPLPGTTGSLTIEWY